MIARYFHSFSLRKTNLNIADAKWKLPLAISHKRKNKPHTNVPSEGGLLHLPAPVEFRNMRSNTTRVENFLTTMKKKIDLRVFTYFLGAVSE